MLYTRPGCHLCDDARRVVEAECARAGVGFDEVDVDGDETLRARYGDDVPVVLVDGAVTGFWRISPDVLRGALA